MNLAATLSGSLLVVFLSGGQPGEKQTVTSFHLNVLSFQDALHRGSLYLPKPSHVLHTRLWDTKVWQIKPWPNAGSETGSRRVSLFVVELAISVSLIGLAVLTLRQNRLKKRLEREMQLSRQAAARSRVNERTSEERYAALARAAPVGIFRGDVDGKCTYVNQCWCQMTGQTLAVVEAEGWQVALYLEDRQRVDADWLQIVKDKQFMDFECRIQRPDGTRRWVYIRIVVEQDDRGSTIGYVGTFTDVDDRKRSEEALKQSEAHQRALVSVLPDLIMHISREGVFLEFLASPNFRVLGKPEDWIGRNVLDMMPPELARQRLLVIERVLETRTIEIYEQDISIEGIVQVEEVRVVPYGTDEVLLLVRDVSDRKQAELALQQSEAQSRSILRMIPDFMCRIGTDGVYREFISSLRDFALVPPTGLAGQSMFEVMPTEIVTQQQYYLQKAVDTGGLQMYEQVVRVGDRIQEEEVRVIKSGPDEALFMIRDISDRKQAEKALKQKLRQEQAISQIVQSIRNSLDLTTIFATATAETAQLHPDINCSVVQYFPQQNLWRIVEKFCQTPNSLDRTGTEIPDEENPLAAQLKQLRIVRVEDTRMLDDRSNQSVAQSTPGAWLLIPLSIEGEIWGSLTLSTPRYGFRWEDELVSLAEAVAGQLEVAIQQAQLYQQVAAERQKLLRSQTALAQAQQIAQIGNWELDIATRSIVCSENLFCIFGYDISIYEPKPASVLIRHIHSDDRSRLVQALSQSSTEGTAFELDLRFCRTDGSMGYLEVRAEAIRDQEGQIVKLFGTSLDITDRKQVEATLERSERRFRNLAANLPGALAQYVLHPDGSDGMLYMSPGCYDLWELTAEEIVADSQALWDTIPDDDEPAMRASIAVSARSLEPWMWEWRAITPSGRTKWLKAAGRPERYPNGDTVWDTVFLDISDRIQIEQRLKHDSLHDSLTGLPNRSLLMERLNLSLRRTNRHSGYRFAVLFLDLDNFKVINDSLGHVVGDDLLISVATILSKTIRETDLAARLGGDEFVVLLDELDNTIEAEQIAERILTLLHTPLQIDGHEVFIGTSIGIALGSDLYHTAEDLLRDADLAMYEAKHSGRGRYAIFVPSMHLQALQRLQVENDLRKALKNDEFVLYYQPVVNLATRDIQGFEALIRWQHPDRGLLLPMEFIEIAEETGLIEPMGKWVLQTACRQLSQWQAQFSDSVTTPTEDRMLQVNVNLSVRQLQSALLLELEETIGAYAIAPNSLGLEITESMLVENIDITVQLLEKIKAASVRISIDDFGTGYSSLSYLHQLPVDSLKIDRSFVSPVDGNTRHQTIAESITALSKLLKLEVIAEGIETEQQLEWLRSLGCKLGQGYLFSPAVSAEQATQMLSQRSH